MTDDQLRRTLQSVGMTAFLVHLDLFDSNLPNSEVAILLETAESWTAKACATRTSHARRILKAGLRTQALHLISAANLPDHVRVAARTAIIPTQPA